MADEPIRKTSGADRLGSSLTPDQVNRALSLGREGAVDDPTAAEMRANRRVSAKHASYAGGGGGSSGPSISFATGRPRDPMFYWQQNNLPYNASKPEELQKIRDYCRLLYQTHPVIASAVDVYSKYPLVGMEFVCKDEALTEFYTSLFFDQLDYEEYLIDIGREHWTVGEAWPLGQFNETLGVWEDDELLQPNDVEVIRSPFLPEPRFEIRLPESLRKILQDRQPAWEFEALMRSYPELANFVGDTARMPVSNVLLKQIKFKGDTFNPRGVPILLRGFRAIMQEEMLNSAQDAIASRLYTPLILAKLGASATDLGTTAPWIPTEDDQANFEEALDAALAADFRVLVHHFAVQMESVFGRENMPNMDADFERLTDRILQVFGLSKTMLSGASSGETYAADALNRDLISQLLTTYQRKIKRFVTDRMLVVAEAQEHFDYEERGGKRYPIMEEVLEVDEETGEQRIVEQPKLLVPELHLKAMTMKDEQDQRQFIEAMIGAGVPISDKTRLTNIPIDLDDEIERKREEQVRKAVEAQETRKETYLALRDRGLPIPDDLRADFEPKAQTGGGQIVEDQQNPNMPQQPPVQMLPSVGIGEPGETMALAPTAEDIAMAQGADPNSPQVSRLPRNKALDPANPGARPPESDEQRAGMPRAAHQKGDKLAVRKVTPIYSEPTEEGEERQVVGHKEEWVEQELEVGEGANRLMSGPRHIGMRRQSGLTKDTPLEDTGT